MELRKVIGVKTSQSGSSYIGYKPSPNSNLNRANCVESSRIEVSFASQLNWVKTEPKL